MTRTARALVTAAIVAVAVVVTGTFLWSRSEGQRTPTQTAAGPATAPAPSAPAQVVRENSRRLSEALGSKVTFVEFLDFECEACRAAFPVVEQLRQQYAGQVTFIIRYLPLSSHFNAERAARAVEAAAQQDRLEPMYQKMYQTQTQWSERRTPADGVFRGFATELGLNMPAFDAAYNDPATAARVKLDVADARALGVMGTPSFFINGTSVDSENLADLGRALQAAVRG